MAKIELTTAEQETLNGIATTLAPPVLTEYPTTDASKAGQRFIYKGNEWHYMTQAEIDSAGWNGLVEVGFPAPVSKVFNPLILGASSYQINTSLVLTDSPANPLVLSGVFDFLGLGLPNLIRSGINLVTTNSAFPSGTSVVTKIVNAHLLVSLNGIGSGTSSQLSLQHLSLNAETINDFFTQLPITNNVVNLSVQNNPGSATCDTTIATAKGYTVITD